MGLSSVGPLTGGHFSIVNSTKSVVGLICGCGGPIVSYVGVSDVWVED